MCLTLPNYKHHNTEKCLIGIMPKGTISFLVKGWGRRNSDQYLTENSKFLEYIVHGDTVKADRGFSIAETLTTCSTHLEIQFLAKVKIN